MKWLNRITLGILLLCLLPLLPPTLTGNAASPRIVAVGDIHGAYTELLSILQSTGLIDANRKWCGNDAVLVQIGDVVDRGEHTRECMDLLMDLEKQAGKAGGRVIPLLGNHEAMNWMGDVRYVTPEIYRSFAGPQSEKLREQAYQDFRKFIADRNRTAGKDVQSETDARSEWMTAHPPGYFEYRDSFGPSGTYGRWIRKHRVIFKAGDVLFVHGGLNPALKLSTVTEIEDRVLSELSGFDILWRQFVARKYIWKYMSLAEALQALSEQIKTLQAAEDPQALEDVVQIQQLLNYRSWLAVSSDGPLWYRGLAQEAEENLMAPLQAMLARFNVRAIVVGHTVQSKSEIISRFDGRVFLIDTGILKEAYSGRASSLEIRAGQFTAFYANGETKVLPNPGTGKAPIGSGRDSR